MNFFDVKKINIFLTAFVFFHFSLSAQSEFRLSSSVQQTQLIELYTSEGCSSCPPADRWLSSFKNSSLLWHKVIPLAFHVDYWDDIGWPDRFAKRDYSLRQRLHAREENIRQVYTPGFVVSGSEWRGWYGSGPVVPLGVKRPGVLNIRIDGRNFVANFNAQKEALITDTLTIAILGSGLTTAIKAGENQGKKLHHDFVVLALETYQINKMNNHWQGQLPSIDKALKPEKLAVALWVTQSPSLKPIQATAGWFK